MHQTPDGGWTQTETCLFRLSRQIQSSMKARARGHISSCSDPWIQAHNYFAVSCATDDFSSFTNRIRTKSKYVNIHISWPGMTEAFFCWSCFSESLPTEYYNLWFALTLKFLWPSPCRSQFLKGSSIVEVPYMYVLVQFSVEESINHSLLLAGKIFVHITYYIAISATICSSKLQRKTVGLGNPWNSKLKPHHV